MIILRNDAIQNLVEYNLVDNTDWLRYIYRRNRHICTEHFGKVHSFLVLYMVDC